MEYIVSDSFRLGRGRKEEHCGITIGLSQSGKTEDGTANDHTVSISMVNC